MIKATDKKMRAVADGMGELKVPEWALYGAQTERAIRNFPISGKSMPSEFIDAVLSIKRVAARANAELGLLPKKKARAIESSVKNLLRRTNDEQFPVDVFQTGSGTSTNMNCNEVIAQLACRESGIDIHPNNDVNMGQSSNDVIPSAIHISAHLAVGSRLLTALGVLRKALSRKAARYRKVCKTGRTHLMDAMPLTLAQEINAWASQIQFNIDHIGYCNVGLSYLAIGGTAIGSGVNTHPKFAALVANHLSKLHNVKFKNNPNLFSALASQDAAVAMSGQLNGLAVSLMKIANDLRWMNSGPLAGLGEISLPALQPGSSIMPGKVNPVIPESVAMVCAQVIGNHTSISVAGQSGNFQLNVMLPLIADRMLESIHLLANAARTLAEKAIEGFTINRDVLDSSLHRNPILVTALNSVCGYEQGAKIAKEAYRSGRSVIEVASEMTDLDRVELKRLLDPLALTVPQIQTAKKVTRSTTKIKSISKRKTGARGKGKD